MKDSSILYQKVADNLNLSKELVEKVIRHKWDFFAKIMGSMEEITIMDHYLGKFSMRRMSFYKDKKRFFERDIHKTIMSDRERKRRIKKINKIEALMRKHYPNIEEYKYYYPTPNEYK